MQKSSAFRISDLISNEEKSNVYRNDVTAELASRSSSSSIEMVNNSSGKSHNWETCHCISCQTLRLINLFSPGIYMNCQTLSENGGAGAGCVNSKLDLVNKSRQNVESKNKLITTSANVIRTSEVDILENEMIGL
jgi:hypothetical protein